MRSELNRLEAIIEEGAAGFRAAGEALLEIREQRLYRFHRDEPATWEAYCRTRWRVSGRHANRLIEAATLVRELGPIGSDAGIRNERQAREMVQVPASQRRRILEELQQSERPTSTQIRLARREIEALSSGQRFEAAQDAEVQALHSLKDLERQRTLARIERLCERLRELHATLPAAAAAEEALTNYLAAVS